MAYEQFWEIAAPMIWALSVIISWHAIATLVRLQREIAEEQRTAVTERESSILEESGDTGQIPRPTRNYSLLPSQDYWNSSNALLRGGGAFIFDMAAK